MNLTDPTTSAVPLWVPGPHGNLVAVCRPSLCYRHSPSPNRAEYGPNSGQTVLARQSGTDKPTTLARSSPLQTSQVSLLEPRSSSSPTQQLSSPASPDPEERAVPFSTISPTQEAQAPEPDQASLSSPTEIQGATSAAAPLSGKFRADRNQVRTIVISSDSSRSPSPEPSRAQDVQSQTVNNFNLRINKPF